MHILHDNTLTQDNRDKFIYLAGHYGQRVNFYNVENLCADKIAEMVRLVPQIKESVYSLGAFFRLLIPKLLPEVDKVIYLDSDIIVNMDIAEFWRVDIGDKVLGAVPAVSQKTSLDWIKGNFALIRDGLVKLEDYFNSGVLVMNLNVLRAKTAEFLNGFKFMAQEPRYFNFAEQDVLNYLYAAQALKLPVKFNRATRHARANEEPLSKAIYHYVGQNPVWSYSLDMTDRFNRLWMDYFIRTPWFDADTIGRLYAGIQQLHVDLKASMIQVSVAVSGKTRAFVTLSQNLEATRQIFAVRADEEIILFESPDSLPKVIDAMNCGRSQKIFFVLLPGFPFNILTDAGFVHGRDFLNGMDFLSEANGVPLDSHVMLKKL